jgi:hypothetical protein
MPLFTFDHSCPSSEKGRHQIILKPRQIAVLRCCGPNGEVGVRKSFLQKRMLRNDLPERVSIHEPLELARRSRVRIVQAILPNVTEKRSGCRRTVGSVTFDLPLLSLEPEYNQPTHRKKRNNNQKPQL